MSEDYNPEPRWSAGDIVYIVAGNYNYAGDEAEGGEAGEDVGQEDLEVVSSDWATGGYVYHLRNDDGERVWGVRERDLQ